MPGFMLGIHAFAPGHDGRKGGKVRSKKQMAGPWPGHDGSALPLNAAGIRG
jgi:hypothetical protein